MCTLTYIPLRADHFLIASNRDELMTRGIAQPPEIRVYKEHKLLYPKDPDAGGSWIAASKRGLVACLLNGAFERHVPKPPYRKSRGLVLLDSFLFDSPHQFIREYTLEDIEPFTIVFFNVLDDDCIIEFRWDGEHGYKKYHSSASSHIWSSVTLYSPEIRKQRELLFSRWLEDNRDNYSLDTILKFHHFKSDDPAGGIKVRFGNMGMTVSITGIEVMGRKLEMIYEDIRRGRTTRYELEIEEPST